MILRLFALLVSAFSVQGCNTRSYSIQANVTVPAEVQKVFSPTAPGVVMSDYRIMGVLCAPSSESTIFRLERVQDYVTCERNKYQEDIRSGTAYAFRPTGAELEQFDVHTREALACGETAQVDDVAVMKDVNGYYHYRPVEEDRYVAVGSSVGECVSSSSYLVNITLALKK